MIKYDLINSIGKLNLPDTLNKRFTVNAIDETNVNKVDDSDVVGPCKTLSM